ncbi:ABC transporter ATP-binding protein [Sporolactobacillus putidus]|uniref:Carnitine transport ATP-binding protein OpuCA n=1 Tax=Sporolactobacillus putidus TaxID=492735 RepID=A0A917S4U9_9BACL|nr:ABC transporter ATP-binding protein [Sporolactobacillus putidus]GGL58506.1 glycine/betaine ABC transporter ATP-binding protein [Sporolactobacillus putidus]
MTETDAIVMEGISKTFKKAQKPSLYPTDLRIESGSFVTILGASGCGKTTLLKMVNRLYEPSSGKILINGQDIARIAPTKLRRQIGYVIQQTGLFRHMTIEQNVAMVPGILGWDKEKINRRIDDLLNLVGLSPSEFRKRYPGQLSGGQQQRIGLARAMAADPSIMLMDEPFGAIDAINRAALQDEILRIQKQLHKTILFVTHDIMEAMKLGDKVIVMNEGKVQQFARPLDILRHPANEFVRDLVHSDDRLQRLAFVRAKDVMNTEAAVPDPDKEAPEAPENSTLHEILMLLLGGRTDYVQIKDEKNNPVGRVTLKEIRRA